MVLSTDINSYLLVIRHIDNLVPVLGYVSSTVLLVGFELGMIILWLRVRPPTWRSAKKTSDLVGSSTPLPRCPDPLVEDHQLTEIFWMASVGHGYRFEFHMALCSHTRSALAVHDLRGYVVLLPERIHAFPSVSQLLLTHLLWSLLAGSKGFAVANHPLKPVEIGSPGQDHNPVWALSCCYSVRQPGHERRSH